jgi:hypothetical protein
VTEALLLRPRLLNLKQVREVCGGIGRDLALQVMASCGKVSIGRRIFVTPESLDAYIAHLKQEGETT